MKHPFTSIRRLGGLVALLLATTITACSDATGPVETDAAPRRSGYLTTSAAVRSLVDVNFSFQYPGVASQYPAVSVRGDTTVESFVVDPTRGSIVILGTTTQHILAIPSFALCHPTLSTYGPTEWQKPCVLATAPITFRVKTWKDAAGRPYADFQPAVRFSPDPTRNVRLYFQDRALTIYNSVFIPYCNAAKICLNEGATDPALETYVSPLVGGGYWVYRKLRHFSGYNVTAN